MLGLLLMEKSSPRDVLFAFELGEVSKTATWLKKCIIEKKSIDYWLILVYFDILAIANRFWS